MKTKHDSASSPMKMPKMPPMLSLDANDLPAIKDWKVGETYEITAKIRMKSLSEGDMFMGGKTKRATFEVEDVQAEPESFGHEYARKNNHA